MNERIKELALQAGGSHYPEVGGKLLEKFAELLIKQCISKIEEAAEHSPELYGVALDIQEYFGVEE